MDFSKGKFWSEYVEATEDNSPPIQIPAHLSPMPTEPPKPTGILPQPDCSPPCSGDSSKGKFWSEFVQATAGDSESDDTIPSPD